MQETNNFTACACSQLCWLSKESVAKSCRQQSLEKLSWSFDPIADSPPLHYDVSQANQQEDNRDNRPNGGTPVLYRLTCPTAFPRQSEKLSKLLQPTQCLKLPALLGEQAQKLYLHPEAKSGKTILNHQQRMRKSKMRNPTKELRNPSFRSAGGFRNRTLSSFDCINLFAKLFGRKASLRLGSVLTVHLFL